MIQRRNHTIHGKKYKGYLFIFVNSMMRESSTEGRRAEGRRAEGRRQKIAQLNIHMNSVDMLSIFT